MSYTECCPLTATSEALRAGLPPMRNARSQHLVISTCSVGSRRLGARRDQLSARAASAPTPSRASGAPSRTRAASLALDASPRTDNIRPGRAAPPLITAGATGGRAGRTDGLAVAGGPRGAARWGAEARPGPNTRPHWTRPCPVRTFGEAPAGWGGACQGERKIPGKGVWGRGVPSPLHRLISRESQLCLSSVLTVKVTKSIFTAYPHSKIIGTRIKHFEAFCAFQSNGKCREVRAGYREGKEGGIRLEKGDRGRENETPEPIA